MGWISGVNQVTAKILDGQDESEAKDAIKSLEGVESTVLNILLEPNLSAGSLKPILENRDADPGPDLSDTEFSLNWPHYVMETFPALALADTVLGSSAASSVVLSILDTGGFQLPTSTGTDLQLSLLSEQTQDTDLAPKVVAPTGIKVDFDPRTGLHSAELRTGAVDPSSNPLIGAGIGNDNAIMLHGLVAASAAVGNGQDILGTGRHVKFRPIKISVNGWCTDDPATVCDSDFDCAIDGKGSCAIGFCSKDSNTPCNSDDQCKAASKGECKLTMEMVPTDWFAGALAQVAEDADIAGTNDSRVLNISMGYPKELIMSNAEIDTAASILRPHLENFISGNRIVVIAAGNEADNTTNRMLAALGPVRGIDRNAAGTALLNQGIMVVSATAFPLIIFHDETTRENFPDWFSNYGPHVSVSAPGEAVPFLKGDLESFGLEDGTSISAPYVAGLAAEMFAVDSTATNAEIASIIEKTADGIETPKPNDYIGYGRINAWKAILTLLNRKSPANQPEWLGFRYRSVATAPPDQVRINNAEIPEADRLVPDIYVKRVPNITQDMEDNSREVPFQTDNFQMATQFSLDTADLENTSGDVVLLEYLDEDGAIVYQIPAVLDDLINQRHLDTSIDDYVITFDIVTDTAAICGQVTSEDKPVSGVAIVYTDINGSQKQTTTESSGVYVIYDAKPDSEFEITASKDGFIGDAHDITAPKFMATRQDFLLEPDTGFPMHYEGKYTNTLASGSTNSGDCRLHLYANGSAAYNYKGEGNTFWYSVPGKHENGGFTIEFNSSFKIEGTYNTDSMSGVGSNSVASMTVWGRRVE